MNIHPFTNRGYRVSQTNCSSRVATAKGQNAANGSTRRWQPRRKKLTCTSPFDQLSDSTNLSEAEKNVLLRQQALAAAQQGHYEESIALFNCLIDRNPDSANDYSNRGLVYFQSGQSSVL